MSALGRRRRGLLLLSLALVCGGLAASEVRQRLEEVESQVGPLVPTVVVKRGRAPDAKLRPGDPAVRRVPARYAPRDSFATVAQVVGLRAAVPLAAGSYLTIGQLKRPPRRGHGLRRGERAVEVVVAGGPRLPEDATSGARVDVLVSTEPRDSTGRTFLALEDVELLGLSPGADASSVDPDGSGERSGPGTRATLRVTVRQAVYLTAAQNFGREVRLLSRPPGDRSRVGHATVGAGGL